MAKLVTMVPLFIRDYNQLEEYIQTVVLMFRCCGKISMYRNHQKPVTKKGSKGVKILSGNSKGEGSIETV